MRKIVIQGIQQTMVVYLKIRPLLDRSLRFKGKPPLSYTSTPLPFYSLMVVCDTFTSWPLHEVHKSFQVGRLPYHPTPKCEVHPPSHTLFHLRVRHRLPYTFHLVPTDVRQGTVTLTANLLRSHPPHTIPQPSPSCVSREMLYNLSNLK